MNAEVTLEVVLEGKLATAVRTRPRLFTCVGSHVSVKVVLPGSGVGAVVTMEGGGGSVHWHHHPRRCCHTVVLHHYLLEACKSNTAHVHLATQFINGFAFSK